MSNFNYYCKFNSTAAYSFGRGKRDQLKENVGPGPNKYYIKNKSNQGIVFMKGNFKNLNFVNKNGPG